ncbi:MAG: DUF4321 domain-containing protein [Candidatus Zixiibacteriota bacterium]|nr:MAG: DUF4321 domain-containing protein [candidate division Zixibacteria bacterium]
MKNRELTFLIVALTLASVLGGFLGELIGEYLPEGAVKTLFKESLEIGLGERGVRFNEIQEPFYINLYSISLAFGLLIKLNFVSVLAVIFVIIYFKWWYL